MIARQSAQALSLPPVPCAVPECRTSTRGRLKLAGFGHPIPLCATHWGPAVASWRDRLGAATRRNDELRRCAQPSAYTVESVAGEVLDHLGVPVGSLGPEVAR